MPAAISSMRSSTACRSGRRSTTKKATPVGSIASAVPPRHRRRPIATGIGPASRSSGPHLAGAVHDVLVARELLHAHRPARMETIGRYPYFRAHAEFTAIGKLRGGIVQYDGTVDALQKACGGGRVGRDDRIGM